MGPVPRPHRPPPGRVLIAACAALVLVGVAARIGFAVTHHGFTKGDQFAYSQLALSLKDHARYSIPLASDPYHWAPGAPVLFAVGLAIFGAGASLTGAYVVQAAISVAALGATWLVTGRLAGRRAAWTATAALAICTGAITSAGDLITEPLGALALIVVVGLFGALLGGEARRPALLAAAAGAALGLAVLTRPDFLVLVPVVLVVVLAARRAPLRARITSAAIAALACAAVMAPYCVVASHNAGQLVLPTTSGGSSFLVGTYLPSDGATYRARGLLAPEIHARFPDTVLRSHPLAVDLVRAVALRRPALAQDVAVGAEVRSNLRRYALGHPFAFARMQARKVARMWSRPYEGHARERTWWGNLLHVPAILAAIAVLIAAARRRREDPVLLLVAAILVAGTAFNALAAVQPRANTRFLPIAFLGATLVLVGPAARRAGARGRRPEASQNQPRARSETPRRGRRGGLRPARLVLVVAAAALLGVVMLADRGPVDPAVQTAARPHGLLSGPGVSRTRKRIDVGVLTAVTGPQATRGRAALRGAQAYFAARNAHGGISGWRVRLVVRDSVNRPGNASAQLPRLSPRIAVLGQSFGFRTTEAILGRVRRLKLAVGLVAAREARLTRDPATAFLGAPYAADAANAVDHLAARTRTRTVALVRDPGAIGDETLQGYRAATARRAPRDVAQITTGAGGDPLVKLRAARPDAVLLATSPAEILALAARAARAGYRPQWVLLDDGRTAATASPAALRPLRGALVAGPTAAWGDTAVPGMRRFLRDVGGRGIRADPAVLEGYAQAAVTAAALRRAIAAKDLTTRGILGARLTLGRVDLGGLVPDATFTPRLGPTTRATTILAIDPGRPARTRTVRRAVSGPSARALRFGP